MKQLFLGIETSGPATGLALATGARVQMEVIERSKCGHNEILVPMLEELLNRAGITAGDLSGIGVDVGPGMFTSLRVGISSAKGLAFARGIPLVGIDSLYCLAKTAQHDLDAVLTLIDARKQQVYAALYVAGKPAIPPVLLSPADAVSTVVRVVSPQCRIAVAGSGVNLCRDQLAAAGIDYALSNIDCPAPGVVALAAAQRIIQGKVDGSVEPMYLRRTDAELARSRNISGQT